MVREGPVTVLALLVLLLALPAQRCAAQGAPPPDQAAEQAGPLIEEILEDDSFHYRPEGRRDPFRSLMVLEEKKKDISKLPPVQQFDLSEVKITGIVLDEAEGPRAMIKAPNNMTFVVKKGMIIGKNEGEVVEVTLQGIRVVEKYIDFTGNETLKEVFIKARPDKK